MLSFTDPRRAWVGDSNKIKRSSEIYIQLFGWYGAGMWRSCNTQILSYQLHLSLGSKNEAPVLELSFSTWEHWCWLAMVPVCIRNHCIKDMRPWILNVLVSVFSCFYSNYICAENAESCHSDLLAPYSPTHRKRVYCQQWRMNPGWYLLSRLISHWDENSMRKFDSFYRMSKRKVGW